MPLTELLRPDARSPRTGRDGTDHDGRPDASPSRTIVCGVDESGDAPAVVRAAATLAELVGARLVLVHVVPEHASRSLWWDPDAASELRTIALERAHRLLTDLAERLCGGVTVDRRVDFGSPAEVLKAVAQQERADLIVVGSQARGALSSMLLGSVSAELCRSAPCPVTVVPPRARVGSLASGAFQRNG